MKVLNSDMPTVQLGQGVLETENAADLHSTVTERAKEIEKAADRPKLSGEQWPEKAKSRDRKRKDSLCQSYQNSAVTQA